MISLNKGKATRKCANSVPNPLGISSNDSRRQGVTPLNILTFWAVTFWFTTFWPAPGACCKAVFRDLLLLPFWEFPSLFPGLDLPFLSSEVLLHCFLVLLVHIPAKKGGMLDTFVNILCVWKCSDLCSHLIHSLALYRTLGGKSISYRVLRLLFHCFSRSWW